MGVAEKGDKDCYEAEIPSCATNNFVLRDMAI